MKSPRQKAIEEMIDSIKWLGKFVKTHEIGDYIILEYKPTKYEGCAPLKGQYEDESRFCPFVNCKSTNCTYSTLEMAIVSAIAYKFDGANSRAAEYFMKSINPNNSI